MNKKKILATSLASVAVLGASFLATQSAVVNANEPTAPAKPVKDSEEAKKEFLANYDKALADSVAELEKGKTTSPEEEKAKADLIAKLKEVAAANKAEIEEAFKNGATVADAEKFLEEAKKTPEEAGKDVEAKKLTADETKKLEEVEKADAARPESEKLQDKADDLDSKIKKLKDKAENETKVAAEKAKKLEEAKKANDTAAAEKLEAEIEELLADAEAKEAEVNLLIEEYNDVLEDLKEAERSESSEAALDKLEEKRTNLEYEIFKLEEKVKTATGEELKKLRSDLAEKRNELVKLTATVESTSDDFEIENLQNEVANLENKLAKKQDKLENLLKGIEGKDDVDEDEEAEIEELQNEVAALEEKLSAKEAELEKALKTLEPKGGVVTDDKNEKLVQPELPEFKGGVNPADAPVQPELPEFKGGVNAADAPVNEVPEYKLPAAPATPANRPAAPAQGSATAGTSQDNTYQAPAAKEEAKEELPNTGGKESAALASVGFLGLALTALSFAKRKN